MPFSIRSFPNIHEQCVVTYHAGTFLKLPLAYVSGFGSRKDAPMPRNRHTVEQILAKLREAEVALSKGQPAAQTCWTLGITEQTYSRWRNEHGGRPLHRLHTYRRIAVMK
jgi:hypothetical protein